MAQLRLNTRTFNRGLDRLKKRFEADAVARAALQAAEATLATAQRKAPFRFGQLRNSAHTQVEDVGKDEVRVRFGFTARYAAVMDSGWKVRKIRPRRAKGLFIPLTRRAARIGPRRQARASRVASATPTPNRRRGRRTPGRRRTGQEFIIVPEVRPPKPRHGQKKGPNYYLSRTVRDDVRSGKALKTIGRILERGLR